MVEKVEIEYDFLFNQPSITQENLANKRIPIVGQGGDDYTLAYDELNKVIDSRIALFANQLIGRATYLNLDNSLKDQMLITTGNLIWALMDPSTILNIVDFPILFSNEKAQDLGNGTFKIRSFFDGTIRHLPKGNNRELGTFQNDAMQRMTGSFHLTYSGEPDGQFLPVISNAGGIVELAEPDPNTKRLPSVASGSPSKGYSTVKLDNSKQVRTDTETRMKNTAGQMYLLAKINFN